jgi:hypothetical protein
VGVLTSVPAGKQPGWHGGYFSWSSFDVGVVGRVLVLDADGWDGPHEQTARAANITVKGKSRRMTCSSGG